jgi:hypothetical protein
MSGVPDEFAQEGVVSLYDGEIHQRTERRRGFGQHDANAAIASENFHHHRKAAHPFYLPPEKFRSAGSEIHGSRYRDARRLRQQSLRVDAEVDAIYGGVERSDSGHEQKLLRAESGNRNRGSIEHIAGLKTFGRIEIEGPRGHHFKGNIPLTAGFTLKSHCFFGDGVLGHKTKTHGPLIALRSRARKRFGVPGSPDNFFQFVGGKGLLSVG